MDDEKNHICIKKISILWTLSVNCLLSGKLCWYDGEWDGGRWPGPAQGEGGQRQGHPQEGEEIVLVDNGVVSCARNF